MKTTVMFIGVLMSVILIFSGCSKEEIDNEVGERQEEDNEETGNVTTDATDKITEIVFWHHYNEQSNENKVLTEIIIPEFEKQNKNIKVETVSHDWADLHKKMIVATTANELPDVARLDSAWIPEFEQMGILLSLNNEFSDFEEVKEEILEGPMNTAKVKGNYYGLGLNTNTKVLFYNNELLESNNLPVPKTMEEFFEVAIKISANSGEQAIWGYGEPGLSGWNVCPLIWSNGGEILNEDYTEVEGYLNSEKNIALLDRLVELYNIEAMSGFNSGDMPMTDGFAQGRYAMLFDGPWKYAELRGGHPDFKSYRTTTMPEGDGGSIQVLGGEDISITQTANKEASWEFVKFMTSEFAQVEMGKVGQIPVNIQAMSNEEIKNIEDFSIFIEALKTAKARPTIAEWPQIDTMITDAFTSALLGAKTPEDALNEATMEIEKIIKK
jgi:multiple sugar transport system substrate-binding protein